MQVSESSMTKEKEALNVVLTASMRHLDKTVNDTTIKAAGYSHVKRQVVESELANIQRKCVIEFCHSNDISLIDTNTYQSIEVVDTDVTVAKHE
eukprot:13730339-Ditylum_brightwellii.AAC.1